MVLMLRFLYIHCILIQFLKNEKKKKVLGKRQQSSGEGDPDSEVRTLCYATPYTPPRPRWGSVSGSILDCGSFSFFLVPLAKQMARPSSAPKPLPCPSSPSRGKDVTSQDRNTPASATSWEDFQQLARAAQKAAKG